MNDDFYNKLYLNIVKCEKNTLRNQIRYFQAAAALKVGGDKSRITDDKLWNRDTGFRPKRGSAGAVIGQSTNPSQPTVFRFDTRRESKISIPTAGKVKNILIKLLPTYYRSLDDRYIVYMYKN